MDSDERPQQQVTGVVIITLPPSDNPSYGKTITAFTLTNDHVLPQSLPLPLPLPDQSLPTTSPPPPPSPQNPQLGFSFSGLFSDNPRKFLGFLSISLFALLLYTLSFSNTFVELRNSNENDDEKPQSFIFPLYHKLGAADTELKLGRFVEVDKKNSMVSIARGPTRTQNINKLVAANVALIDPSATTILPVRGNVYPDGLYFTYMLVGNPQRPYFLDIDTGSDLTWIQCDAPCSSCAKGANPLYKPARGNIITPKDSMCMEVQKNQKPQNCETCQQCDYEIEYADHSSSLGVLARDKLHLVSANGSVTKLFKILPREVIVSFPENIAAHSLTEKRKQQWQPCLVLTWQSQPQGWLPTYQILPRLAPSRLHVSTRTGHGSLWGVGGCRRS